MASLASSSTLVAGRESTLVDNSVNLYLDYKLGGRITTGTTPTAGTVEVNVIEMMNDTTWPDVFDGTDSVETVTSIAIKNSICRPAIAIATDATSNQPYDFSGISVAGLFGGTCPRKFVVFVSHSTVAALHATGGNHFIDITPSFLTST